MTVHVGEAKSETLHALCEMYFRNPRVFWRIRDNMKANGTYGFYSKEYYDIGLYLRIQRVADFFENYANSVEFRIPRFF